MVHPSVDATVCKRTGRRWRSAGLDGGWGGRRRGETIQEVGSQRKVKDIPLPRGEQLEQKPSKKPWNLASEGRQLWASPDIREHSGREGMRRCRGLWETPRGHAGPPAPRENGMTSTPSLPDKLGTAGSSDAGAADLHKVQLGPKGCCQRGPCAGAGAGAAHVPGRCGAHSAFPRAATAG